jgi:hypothetical protein
MLSQLHLLLLLTILRITFSEVSGKKLLYLLWIVIIEWTKKSPAFELSLFQKIKTHVQPAK